MLTSTILAGHSNAADLTTEVPPAVTQTPEKQWTFTLTSYLWTAGLSGNIGVRGKQSTNVNSGHGTQTFA
jgi:hypothetical protein